MNPASCWLRFLPAWTPLRCTRVSRAFLRHWQRLYRVLPEFKVVVADMQTFLTDLRLWLEQVELEIRSAPSGNRLEMEQRAVQEIGRAMVPAFDAMHERLESVSEGIEAELRPVHQNFAKRQLHPLVMCSPFAYRTYHKPLGYAGDYEMVNMILRDPYEGSSLFAKVVNLWFLSQWPARAHRNRIRHLKGFLKEETRRGAGRGRPVRVLNLGCGPAREVQEFLAEDALCDHAQFTSAGFQRGNHPTHEPGIGGTQAAIRPENPHPGSEEVRAAGAQGGRQTRRRCAGPADTILFIAPACLIIFPTGHVVQLMNIFYDWLAPGGLLAATNVEDCKPFRHMLEFVLDWHLIYRGMKKSAALLPQRAVAENVRASSRIPRK